MFLRPSLVPRKNECVLTGITSTKVLQLSLIYQLHQSESLRVLLGSPSAFFSHVGDNSLFLCTFLAYGTSGRPLPVIPYCRPPRPPPPRRKAWGRWLWFPLRVQLALQSRSFASLSPKSKGDALLAVHFLFLQICTDAFSRNRRAIDIASSTVNLPFFPCSINVASNIHRKGLQSRSNLGHPVPHGLGTRGGGHSVFVPQLSPCRVGKNEVYRTLRYHKEHGGVLLLPSNGSFVAENLIHRSIGGIALLRERCPQFSVSHLRCRCQSFSVLHLRCWRRGDDGLTTSHLRRLLV